MRLPLLILLAGCTSKAPEAEGPMVGFECRVLREAPGTALARMSALTADPVEVWRTIEVCGADGTDVCAKALAGHRAVPSMAVADGLDTRPFDAPWLAACRQLSPGQQRCMRISARMADAAGCRATGAAAAHAAVFRP